MDKLLIVAVVFAIISITCTYSLCKVSGKADERIDNIRGEE